tara:strand:+ start:4786 stop:5640 length:855 start_codon:yes stop_codon:yes gene_type:complete
MLGILVFGKRDHAWRNNIWLYEVYQGAICYAKSMGYEVDVFWMGDEKISAKRFNNILLTRNLQGLILPPEHEGTLPLEIDWNEFAVVSLHLGKPNGLPWFHQVVSNHYQSMSKACKECYELGYNRVGLVLRDHPNRHYQFGRAVFGAFSAQVVEQSAEDRIEPLVLDELSKDRVEDWVMAEKPECVLMAGGGFSLDNRLEDYAELFKRCSLRLGYDIGYVLMCQQDGVNEAGIDQRMGVIGESAARLLIDMITRNERGIPDDPMLQLVNCSWREGSSLPMISSD